MTERTCVLDDESTAKAVFAKQVFHVLTFLLCYTSFLVTIRSLLTSKVLMCELVLYGTSESSAVALDSADSLVTFAHHDQTISLDTLDALPACSTEALQVSP